jgi:hypothetical protein
MAKEDRDLMALPLEELTNAELQTRILRMQMQREILTLEDTEEAHAKLLAMKKQRSLQNAQRQAELRGIAVMHRNIQSGCRHRQGGYRHQLYSGGGKPCVTKFIMPDGVTAFYQCNRCRLKEYTPHRNLLARDPEAYRTQKMLTDKLEELWVESNLDFIKGPTFAWMKDGVPFVPEMAGAITDQKGY